MATITINKAALEQVVQVIGNRSAEELKKVGDEGSLLLKKIASDFLQEVELNLQKIQLLQSNALKLKEKRRSLNFSYGKPPSEQAAIQYYNFKTQLQNQIEINTNLDNFFVACLKFNDQIIEIVTGRKQKISVVIPQAGGGPIVASYTLSELLDEKSGVSIVQDITSGKILRVTGRLKFDINTIKENLKQALQQDTIIDPDQLSKLNITYNSALANYTKHNPYAFWKISDEEGWNKMKITGGAGDISEAYAYFYYKNTEKQKFFGDNLYSNLGVFFTQGVGQVSNLSGLYKGDISTDKYEYAIKSLNASLPGYRQMIILANSIINNKIATVDQLKNKALKAQFKDPIKQQGEKGLRNVVQKIVENIQSSMR